MGRLWQIEHQVCSLRPQGWNDGASSAEPFVTTVAFPAAVRSIEKGQLCAVTIGRGKNHLRDASRGRDFGNLRAVGGERYSVDCRSPHEKYPSYELRPRYSLVSTVGRGDSFRCWNRGDLYAGL